MSWLQIASAAFPTLHPQILLAEQPDVKASVTALQSGAKDYLPLPATTSDLMAAVERATAYSVRKPVRARETVEMIGSSEIMNTLRQRIAKVGRQIHCAYTRSVGYRQGTCCTRHTRGFVGQCALDHAQLRHGSANLIEAELFDWLPMKNRRSGTTGWSKNKASGGTLFG